MSISICSGIDSTLLTIDPTSKAARITEYGTDGEALDYVPTFRGAAATFRTLGSAATPQPLFTIENTAASTVWVMIKGLFLVADMTAALTSVACQIDSARSTAIPTGGTILTKAALDTDLTSNAEVIPRGATASDGGGATAITATLGTLMWRNFIGRLHTAVGQVMQPYMIPLLPCLGLDNLIAKDCTIVRPGQAIVSSITGTAGSNAATNHYIVMVQWDEVAI